MKFKLDENMPAELAHHLRADGYDAYTVAEQELIDAVDPLLLSRVKAEGRAFLTMDKGIADVRKYPPRDFAGLIVFRTMLTGRSAVLQFALTSLRQILQAPIEGKLFVVTDGGIRVRRSDS